MESKLFGVCTIEIAGMKRIFAVDPRNFTFLRISFPVRDTENCKETYF